MDSNLFDAQHYPPFEQIGRSKPAFSQWIGTLKSNCAKGPVIIYRLGGEGGGGVRAEDFALKTVKFSRSPFECYFTEVIPPNNF